MFVINKTVAGDTFRIGSDESLLVCAELVDIDIELNNHESSSYEIYPEKKVVIF